MRIALTSDRMLEEWKLRRAIGPLRADCTVTRTDGMDLDALLRAEMRGWYLRLLDTAPAEMLAPEDIAASITSTSVDPTSGAMVIGLPDGCRRVLEIQLAGWHTAAVPAEADAATLRRMANPFTRGSVHLPVALMSHGRLLLWPMTATPPDRLIAVMDPGSELYVMDERALELITPDNSLLP